MRNLPSPPVCLPNLAQDHNAKLLEFVNLPDSHPTVLLLLHANYFKTGQSHERNVYKQPWELDICLVELFPAKCHHYSPLPSISRLWRVIPLFLVRSSFLSCLFPPIITLSWPTCCCCFEAMVCYTIFDQIFSIIQLFCTYKNRYEWYWNFHQKGKLIFEIERQHAKLGSYYD